MKYAEFLPATPLRHLIDAYWVMETDALFQPFTHRIIADGCVDILINIGASTPYYNQHIPLLPGAIYLGGTMMRPGLFGNVANTHIIGIRFKPAGFSFFYELPLDQFVDQLITFHDNALMSIIGTDDLLITRLDHFFISKIQYSSSLLISMTTAINHCKGLISVDLLANNFNVSTRTLERIFKKDIGVPPKDFINLTRFKNANKRILKKSPAESLSNIAYEMGYYDHSHLTREIRKYTGLNPSEIAPLP